MAHIEYDMWKKEKKKITKNIKQVVVKEVKKVEKEEKVVTKGVTIYLMNYSEIWRNDRITIHKLYLRFTNHNKLFSSIVQ